ncbi:MAG: hypothetical protein FJX71_05090 [Alphaproteobacteria bacterium]|nr:hypothetical protein [Alphaproteobacteria bacterium]
MTPIFKLILFAFIIVKTCYSTEEGDASFAAALRELRTTPQSTIAPSQAFKNYMSEIGLGTEASIKPAVILLLDNYQNFSNEDLKTFLSTHSVIAYLKRANTGLEPAYARILLALSLFHGWGLLQDQPHAYRLVTQEKDLGPPGLEPYLRWCFFKESGWRSDIRKSQKGHHNDLSVLQSLIASALRKFEPAQRELQRVAEYSGLLFNMKPILSGLVLPLTIESAPIEPGIPSTSLLEVTRSNADHFYALTALATYLARNGERQPLANFNAAQNVSFQATPAPHRLRDVWSHTLALLRDEQKEAHTRGINLFVNFHSLQRDPIARSLYFPLEGKQDVDLYIVHHIEEWFKTELPKSHDKIDHFFKSLRDIKTLHVQFQIVAQLQRLRSHLATMGPTAGTLLTALLNSGPLGIVLMQIEHDLFKHQPPSVDEFIQCVCIGLSQARTIAALSLAHRADHKGTYEEEKFYAKLFRDLFFLPLKDAPLDPTHDVNTCMKPKHTALAFFKGDGPSKGWADPETFITCTYEFIHSKPEVVIQWLVKNMDARIKAKLEQSDAPLVERLWKLVATEDRKEIKKEIIPLLLMHEQINYLADTPDYK